MPLVRSTAVATPQPARAFDRAAIEAALAGEDPEAIRAAAAACRDQPDGIALLSARLAGTDQRRMSELLIFAIAAIGGAAAGAALASLLRDADPQRRFAAVEALRGLGPDALAAFDRLLRDPDPQVRMLAAEIARGPCTGPTAAILAEQLGREDDLNVCCAFVDILAEIGSECEAPALRALAQRFPQHAFLRFSVETALARIVAAPDRNAAGQ